MDGRDGWRDGQTDTGKTCGTDETGGWVGRDGQTDGTDKPFFRRKYLHSQVLTI